MALDAHHNHTASSDDRIIIHFDLDAFYVACERELNADLRGVAVGVSQYNPYGSLEERAANDIHKRLVRTPNTATKQQEDVNGSLIAVSYEARAAGVKRNDRGVEAARKCPDLHIVVVPVKHGKADLTMYRSASKRVMQTLSKAIQSQVQDHKNANVPVEVASIDEVYVDVTDLVNSLMERLQNDDTLWKECMEEASKCTTIGGIETLSDAAEAANALDKNEVRKGSRLQVMDASVDEGSMAWWNRSKSQWCEEEIRLACGAWIAARARKAVVEAFDGGVFTLSAGVSANKTLAKLASGLKKPNRQTLINPTDPTPLEKLFHPLPLSRIRGLGGKFGLQISDQFQVTTVGQISQIPLTTLQSQLDDKTARFLYDISRGICRDPVTPRTRPKSIACGKTFRGRNSIMTHDQETLTKWVGELCSELTERLEADNQEYNRTANTLLVSVGISQEGPSASRQCRAPRLLSGYHEVAVHLILQLIEAAKSRLRADSVTVTSIYVSATQFVEQASGSSTIMAAFGRSKAEGTNAAATSPQQSRSPLQSRKPKPSIMDNWLSDIKKTAGTKRSSGAVDSSDEKRLTVSSNAVLSSDNTSARPPVALPTLDEIDPQVLRELPEELRASLMKDISRAHPPKKVKGGIQHFFQRKD